MSNRTEYHKVIYQVKNHRATVTINRPEVMNAFGCQTLLEI